MFGEGLIQVQGGGGGGGLMSATLDGALTRGCGAVTGGRGRRWWPQRPRGADPDDAGLCCDRHGGLAPASRPGSATMRATMAIAGTELRRFARDRSNIFFMLIFPMLLVLVLGLQFGGGS